MKNKIIACLITMSILVALIPGQQVYAGESEAATLNEMNILRGDGKSFDLGGYLKRSEAVAFIVRVLNKEEEVLAAKSKYSDTIFPDVADDSWYAAYVGYCVEQGILSGYNDGNFRPDERLSEKAFLKMMISALGYEYGEDYTWSNVYQMAYDIKLVTDKAYETKSDVNTEYKRGDVVDRIFKGLTLPKKSTGLVLVYDFVDAGTITKDRAKELGLIVNSVALEILSASTNDNETIELELSEKIQSIKVENVSVVKKGDGQDTKKVKHIVVEEKKLLIVLEDKLNMDDTYIIYLLNVTDELGNQEDGKSIEVNGYRDVNIVTDYFRIKNVELVDNDSIRLTYTHPINENALIKSYYTMTYNSETVVDKSTRGLTIALDTQVDNAVIIKGFKSELTLGRDYRIAVSPGLYSAYGVMLNDGSQDTIKFTYNSEVQQSEFELINVTVASKNTLILGFSEDVNDVIAEQVFSYYLTDNDKKAIAITSAVSSEKNVTLTVNTEFSSVIRYTILINRINNVSKTASIEEKSHDFMGLVVEQSKLVLTSAFPLDANTIMLEFNKPLDVTMAEFAANYYVSGVTKNSYFAVPTVASYEVINGQYFVRLYMGKNDVLVGTDKYKANVAPAIRDIYGVDGGIVQSKEFSHNGSAIYKTTLTKGVTISKDTIKLEFSKPILQQTPNIVSNNYTLKYKDDNDDVVSLKPIGILYYEPNVIILRFTEFDDYDYWIEYDTVIDITGNEVQKPDNYLIQEGK